MKKIAVLVNTCDKFRDCWDPFFILWLKYGLAPESCHLYLNTERAEYSFAGCEVTPLKVCTANNWNVPKPPTWSWCLLKALEGIAEDYVLYMQEDYFLTAQCDEGKIAHAVALMDEHPEIDCIHLTSATFSKKHDCEFDELWEGNTRDWYYVNCQGAIWRKSTLQKLPRMHESAWDFERWASARSRLMRLRYFQLRAAEDNRVLPYILTGVIQGKWYEPVVELFRENGIEMDFRKRGFYPGRFPACHGNPIAYIWVRLRWAVRGTYKRYFSPFKSLMEVLRWK